ncbi:hypothetical protein C8P63_13132 [Melghirimyces profundicolus]|uniref:Uncharacterized protein n=1 Tax=Melghirimyces profundicolus TaxID=1242148 RepID=A0A2T6B837_9BACL|nr:hypothetical protein C8P63_13132 [Melghirimyces profundicolus]
MSQRSRGCPKCGSTDAETGKIATTGSGISRILDWQNNEFHVVSCKSCGYSEFYRTKGSTGTKLLDLFFGG